MHRVASRLVLLAASLMLAGAAFAQAPSSATAGFSIQNHGGPREYAHPVWTIAVSGIWPTHCPPTLENVALEGRDLRIDTRSVLELCERGATPFSVELNPALLLEHSALTPGVYHVSFYAADGAQAPARLRAFALVDRSLSNAPAIEPETGFWWSSGGSAPGADRTTLSLELQDGQLSVALLSYDDLGQPVWYFGAAPYAGRIAHLPLLHLAGGSAPFAAVVTPPHGDSTLALDLEFSSAAHASAWLTRQHGFGSDASLQSQMLDLVRLPLADSADGQAWQGDWVLVADAADSTPQRLRFEDYRALDSAHFQIGDSTAKVMLVCERKPAQPDWPPSSCTLQRDDGGVLGHFTSVALARMDGQRDDRAPVHLLRVTR